MLVTRKVRIIVGRCYDDEHPWLSLREIAFSSWWIWELDNELNSYLILVVRSFKDYGWSLEESLLLECGLGSTWFSFTIISSRFLQIPFNLGVDVLPWLWRAIIEQLWRRINYSKLKSLLLTSSQDQGTPTIHPLPPFGMIHIKVASYHHTLWLAIPEYAWETRWCNLLWLLEEKQFDRGGFVIYPLYM